MWVTNRQICGAVANWAVRQSPYPGGPRDLTLVLQMLERSIRQDADRAGMLQFAERDDLEIYLIQKLRAIPEYVGWNERKNGNTAPFKFTSAFTPRGDPDDDFIDISALEGNVVRSIDAEERANA